jgi:hypothetical protein
VGWSFPHATDTAVARITQVGSVLLLALISLVSTPSSSARRARGSAFYWSRGNRTKTLPRLPI